MVSFFTKQFELDIEFKGGSVIEVELGQAFENNEIEEALTRVISTIEDDSNPEEILRKALTCLSM